MWAGPRTHVVRVTCFTRGDATRVRIRQDDHLDPLAVDLDGLGRALGTTAAVGRGRRDHRRLDEQTTPSSVAAVAAKPPTGPPGEELGQ